MYWNFDAEPSDDDTVKWRMDFEKLQSDVIQGIRQREEEATLYVVLDYLRSQGYGVTEPGAQVVSETALVEWLEKAVEVSKKTAKEAKKYEAPPSYWQGRAEAYKLVLNMIEVGRFDG